MEREWVHNCQGSGAGRTPAEHRATPAPIRCVSRRRRYFLDARRSVLGGTCPTPCFSAQPKQAAASAGGCRASGPTGSSEQAMYLREQSVYGPTPASCRAWQTSVPPPSITSRDREEVSHNTPGSVSRGAPAADAGRSHAASHTCIAVLRGRGGRSWGASSREATGFFKAHSKLWMWLLHFQAA